MIEETTGRLDFGVMRGAIERKDPDAHLGFYAEDAELRVVHEALPDSKAFELKGRGQIGRYLKAVCDQEVSCGFRDPLCNFWDAFRGRATIVPLTSVHGESL